MTAVKVNALQTFRSYAAQCEHYLSRRHECTPCGSIQTDSAWRGADLLHSDKWRYELTDAQIEELDRALLHGNSTGKPLSAWTVEDFPLPSLSSAIDHWRSEINFGLGFVLLSGLPVERWGQDNCERFFWAFGLHLGIPGGQNPAGDLLGHVTDTGLHKTEKLSRLYQSSAKIRYHCDAADVVGLLCLHPGLSGGASRIVSSVTVWNELRKQAPEFAARLFEPTYVDLRNEHSPGQDPWNVLTPCTFADGVLRTFYHADYFRSVERHKDITLGENDHRLFDLYDEIANSMDLRLDMQLEPGDIQLVSNHTILHARSEYKDGPDQVRHLLRLWLSL